MNRGKNTYSRLLICYYRNAQHRGKRFVWYFLRRLTGFHRLQIPYGAGVILLDERDPFQATVLRRGISEPETWDTLKLHVQQKDILWDIGANIGSFALQTLDTPEIAEVHCFEPNPVTIQTLRINMEANAGFAQIHPIGVSDANRTEDLYLDNTGLQTTASFAFTEGREKSVEVACFTVDTIIEQHIAPLPQLLKIDVEGYEEKVLRGAMNLLKHHPPRAILFEAKCNQDAEIIDQSLLKMLEGYGYSVEWIPRYSGQLNYYYREYAVENYIAIYQGK